MTRKDEEFELFKKKKQREQGMAVDDDGIDFYRFEIGYSIAFNQVVYTIVFLYSLISPIITLFGALYFTIKYFVDKYNLTHVYPKNYDSRGELAKYLSILNHLSIYFQQFILIGLFTIALQRKNLYYALICFLIFQVIISSVFSMSDHFELLQRHFRIRGNYLTEEQEWHLSYQQGILDVEETRLYEQQQKIIEEQNDQVSHHEAIEQLRQSIKLSLKRSLTASIDEPAKRVEDSDVTDDIVMQQYKHPVEQFMITQDWQFFYEDFSEQVVELLDHLQGQDKSQEISELKDQIMSAFRIKPNEERSKSAQIQEMIK
jgi:hypothetical protein